MTLIYSMILCLFFKARTCQLQCVKEAPNDAEFQINVTTHMKVEHGDCVQIPYEFTFPTNKITEPFKKIWFKGDPQNAVFLESVHNEYETRGTFMIDFLPHGEYEYGLKLEWECNQTYIFPKRVQISVSAFTLKPTMRVPPMMEEQAATLECEAPRLSCSGGAHMYWKWSKFGGSTVLRGHDNSKLSTSVLHLTPFAEDHNTNITCVADYDHNIVETTVTLTVKFAPKILNVSQCMVTGKLLVCVCISRGNPRPLITWPLTSLTDFSVTGFSRVQTMNSTITMLVADINSTGVKCTSSNEHGQAQIEIPLQIYNYGLASNSKSDADLSWIIAGVSLSLNLVLLTILIICANKRAKRQPKELAEDMDPYACLNLADVEQVYSVISLETR